MIPAQTVTGEPMPEVRVVSELEVMGPAHAAKRPARAGDLWVVVQVAGRRKRQKVGRPTERNIARAEELRADWQAALDEQLGVASPVTALETFRGAAESFLASGMRMRASRTKRNRGYQVKALIEHFGDTPLARIDAAAIGDWWDREVQGKRDWRTGGFYLDCASLIFKHAQRSGVEVVNPVPAARERLIGDIASTKEYRSRNQSNMRPLQVEQLQAFLKALESESLDFIVSCVLLYECGLRFGEMRALTWGGVFLGKDADDTTRHLFVEESETEGIVGATKTGTFRKVALSRRARALLLSWRMLGGRPRAADRVVAAHWNNRFIERLTKVCERAKIPRFTPKDLRDTFASLLITHGIVLKWISLQLGHSRVGTTEQHYAAYMAIDGYQNPWMVPPGCLPTDLFAELDGWRVEVSATIERSMDGRGGRS